MGAMAGAQQLPQQRLGNIEEDQIVELAHLAPQALLGRVGQNSLDLLIPLGERHLQMTIRGLGHPLKPEEVEFGLRPWSA
jgi:hypothetical protein